MAYHHWQVGLDIQNGCLRALAVLRRRHGWQLRQWWQIPLPADTLREGSLHHSDALCDVLTQWRRGLPRRISLRVGFPAQRVLQQLMAAPDSRLREPERGWYIDHQAACQFPIGRESLVLDYRSEPQSPGSLLITAAKREEVAQWQHCLHRAGLSPDVLDIVPCALRTMAQLAGVASDSLLLHRLDTEYWLWVSPLSQPLSFGVISQEVATDSGDIVTCVSNHYIGKRGEITYYSGECGEDMPLSVHPLASWSPFDILHQAYPPLPLNPSQFVVAGGLALRADD